MKSRKLYLKNCNELVGYARESLKSQLSLLHDFLYPTSLRDAITSACSSTVRFLLADHTLAELEELYEDELETIKNTPDHLWRPGAGRLKSYNLLEAMNLLKLAKKENKTLSAEISKLWPSRNLTFIIKEELLQNEKADQNEETDIKVQRPYYHYLDQRTNDD